MPALPLWPVLPLSTLQPQLLLLLPKNLNPNRARFQIRDEKLEEFQELVEDLLEKKKKDLVRVLDGQDYSGESFFIFTFYFDQSLNFLNRSSTIDDPSLVVLREFSIRTTGSELPRLSRTEGRERGIRDFSKALDQVGL